MTDEEQVESLMRRYNIPRETAKALNEGTLFLGFGPIARYE